MNQQIKIDLSKELPTIYKLVENDLNIESYRGICSLLEMDESTTFKALSDYGKSKNYTFKNKEWKSLWKNISNHYITKNDKNKLREIYLFLDNFEKRNCIRNLEKFIIEDVGYTFLGGIFSLGDANTAVYIRNKGRSLIELFNITKTKRKLNKN